MPEKHIESNESKGISYGDLEEYARGKIREHLQDLLEQEVREWLGRCRVPADSEHGISESKMAM